MLRILSKLGISQWLITNGLHQRCCLHVFLIDQRDYKDVPLNKLFYPVVTCLLQPDTLEHVIGGLDINVAELQWDVHDETDDLNIGDDQDSFWGDFDDTNQPEQDIDMPVDADHEDDDEELDPPDVGGAGGPSNKADHNDGFLFSNDYTRAPEASQAHPDANRMLDDECDGGVNSEVEVLVWTSGQFWNFIDHTLESLRKSCLKNSSGNAVRL